MGLGDVTDRDAVLMAIAEFKELGRDAFLARYGFRRARPLPLEYDGDLYDSKPILGAAHGYQHPDLGPMTHDQFSGGEVTTKRRLEDLGFHVVERNDEGESSDSDLLPIGELIEQVLALQPSWSKDNTSEMQLRGRLVRQELPRTIRALLPSSSTLPFTASVEGQDGVGRKAKIPWVRIFSKGQSPSATTGWYVVLLFAADGHAAYLALGSGTSTLENGTMRLPRRAGSTNASPGARTVLGDMQIESLARTIDLADPQGLGAQYEKGTVCAVHYPADAEIDDTTFSTNLEELLTLLSELYSEGEQEPDEELVAETEYPIHLLLKWNPTDDPETMDKHLAVASARGSVWWGSVTRGTRRVPDARIAVLQNQLDADIPTFAYLYRTGPHPAVWRAEIEAVTNKREETDAERVPSYYPPEQRHSVYVRIRDITPVDLEWLRTDIARAAKPISGSLASGLRSQTSPLYVVEVGTLATATVPLTRGWLADRSLWTDYDLDELLDALLGPSPQVILAGPPGTGKSWVA